MNGNQEIRIVKSRLPSKYQPGHEFVSKKTKARPERFELPTLWFEGGASGTGVIVISRLGRLPRLPSVQLGLIWSRLRKGLCKAWPLRIGISCEQTFSTAT